MQKETSNTKVKKTSQCWCGNNKLEQFSNEYLLCSTCGTLIVAIIPETDLTRVQDDNAKNELYSKNYWLEHSREDLHQSDIYSRSRTDMTDRCINWLRVLLQYKLPEAKAIDIGCGHGGFVSLMQAAGYNAIGLEISPWVVDFGKKTFDISMHVGSIQQQTFKNQSFDVIILMDVLEHLQDPMSTLTICKQLLKNNGMLFIQMPDFPFGKSYETLKNENAAFLSHMLKDEHLFLFSRAAIIKLLKEKLNIQHIQFEKAVFDHYDMFLVASQTEFVKNENSIIDDFLLSKPNLRLLLAMLDLDQQTRYWCTLYNQADKDRIMRLEIIEKTYKDYLASDKDKKELSNQVMILSNKTIAVDLTPVLSGGDNGGAKILAIELVKEMAKIMPQCNFILLTSFWSHKELSQLENGNIKLKCVNNPQIGIKPKPQSRYVAKVKRILKRVYNKTLKQFVLHSKTANNSTEQNSFDLLFCPFTAPLYHQTGVPTVCVVLDIQYHFYPQFFTTEDRAQRRNIFIDACEKANHIITISDYVKQTIIDNSPYDIVGKTETIYIGLDNRLPSINNHLQNELFQKFLITKENYLLYPANYWKHKNHEILLTAFAMYIHKFPNSSLKLICTGAPSERLEYLKAIVIKMKLQDRIKFAGFLSNEEFSAVFAGCKAIIYPSLFEGFGMPILEAMANAKPVICSNCTSVPEIAGESAIYFDPRKPTEIVAAIQILELDSNIIQEKIEYGLRRAEEIGNVTTMAEKYLNVFAKVIKSVNHGEEIACEKLLANKFSEKNDLLEIV